MMSRIKNFLFNKNLILNIVYTLSSLGFAIFVMMKYYIGYSELGATIFYVMFFLFLFFTSVLIFFDKEEAKNFWIMFGLGFLTGFWNIFGWKNYAHLSYSSQVLNVVIPDAIWNLSSICIPWATIKFAVSSFVVRVVYAACTCKDHQET